MIGSSPDKWAEIERLRQATISAQTDRISLECARDAVGRIWRRMGLAEPRVQLHASPAAARAAAGNHADQYWSIWWRAWSAWYQGGVILGVQFDRDLLDDFTAWAHAVSYVALGDDGTVHVADNPIRIEWSDERRLHCDHAKAVEYVDGWGLWAIDGVSVNEQIVLRPETQTVQQIDADEHLERRAIRIERYGWLRYLESSSANVVELRRNTIEHTVEILVDTSIGQRLLTYCPSTGRRFALSIPPPAVRSCADAQSRLWGDRGVEIIGRT